MNTTEIAIKLYLNSKNKGLTNTEIAQKINILYQVAVKMGSPCHTLHISREQAMALYTIQSILHRTMTIATSN